MEAKKSHITFSHKIKIGTLIVLINCVYTFLLSCGSNSSNAGLSEDNDNEKSKYPDGDYCADVTYYNPNTGTRSTYTLNVEVEGNELTKINWPNGGWLDDSHFSPEELVEDGSCSFTSDRGYSYDVKIIGENCSSTSSASNPESNSTASEVTFSLEDCANAIQMTEQELVDYEKSFNASRYDKVNEAMCLSIKKYIYNIREINKEKSNFDLLINEGYIQKKYTTSTGDMITCQTLVVKRNGRFYLMEVRGAQKTTMGLMQFNPEVIEWQEVFIMEDPQKPVWNSYVIRIIEESMDLSSLTEKMEVLCNN